MTHMQKMQQFLVDHDISMNVTEFVSVTSNIYHSFEAEKYDERHESISQSKKYWMLVTNYLSNYFINKQNLQILDFGCGTGFAISRILDSKLNQKIEKVSCYDLSEDMIAQCKLKFSSEKRLIYYANQPGLENMLQQSIKYDLIVCNALVHHLIEPHQLFATVNELLAPNGVFVMGHEPNKAYYTNLLLQKVAKIFRFYKKINRRLKAKKPTSSGNIAVQTHHELVKRGIVKTNFPASMIPKFVDIHVPLSNYISQPWGELGFDLSYINQYLDQRFSLVNQITYNHIKDESASSTFIWKKVQQYLANKFPFDGADAIFIFKKDK